VVVSFREKPPPTGTPMIYCICQSCNCVVLFQEGDIGHEVVCRKCGARFTLSARQMIDPPIVVDKTDKGRVLKFRCQCGRKLAIPHSMKAEHVKCPRCDRMAPVPPWPDDAAAGIAVVPDQAAGRNAEKARAQKTKAHRMASIASLCWVAFLLCLIASGGGVLGSEIKLSGLNDSKVRFNARSFSASEAVAGHVRKDVSVLDDSDFMRYKKEVLEREETRWMQVRHISLYVMCPITALVLFFGVVMNIRNKARMRRLEAHGAEQAPEGGANSGQK